MTTMTRGRTLLKWLSFLLSLLLSGCLFSGPTGSAIGIADKPLSLALEKHVQKLAVQLGPRSYLTPSSRSNLQEAALYIEKELHALHGTQPSRVRILPYTVPEVFSQRCDWYLPSSTVTLRKYEDLKSIQFKNIEFEIRGASKPEELIVIGAHYDSDAYESSGYNPGADDNATGVAALIELARMLMKAPLARTVRFVAFSNEEEPFFHGEWMGSYRYARETEGEGRVKAMLSLETMGYFTDKPGSQTFLPMGLDSLFGLPDKGNFIAFVGNWKSAPLVRHVFASFTNSVVFPAAQIAMYSCLPGIGWSDHWSYWQFDVPAIMVTDTAPNRNPCYHQPCDTISNLDFDRLALVVVGLAGTVASLADPAKWP